MKMPYEYLMEFFHYDPESGKFHRTHFINRLGEKYPKMVEIKAVNHSGYLVTTYKKRLVKVHLLAHLYMTGEYPSKYVDHIDGDRMNNKWANLRVVEKVDNQRNQGVRIDNVSGRTGVYWYPPLGKWQAQIMCNGMKYHLGYFETVDEACAARKGAEALFGFHLNHGERQSWRK